MTVQRRNPELVDLLTQDFVLRREPNFAWKSACSAHQELLGLRGFWPMSTFNESGNAYDLSGQGRTMTYNVGLYSYPLYWTYDLAPYIAFDGAGGYLARADEAGLDILGTEAYVAAQYRGLTLGCWAWFDNDGAATTEGLITKRDGAAIANVAYAMYRHTTDVVRFTVSTGAVQEWIDTPVVTSGGWHHFMGRWDPSTELSVFMDGTEYPAGGSAIAAIQNHTANFHIGSRDNGAGGAVYIMDGKIALAWLCAAYLPDPVVFSIYQQTRGLFGV